MLKSRGSTEQYLGSLRELANYLSKQSEEMNAVIRQTTNRLVYHNRRHCGSVIGALFKRVVHRADDNKTLQVMVSAAKI
jgi:hypothetical protein